jgi:hypothetical protein
MRSAFPRVRLLVALAVVIAISSIVVLAASARTLALTATITSSSIGKHSAKFTFEASGLGKGVHAIQFFCNLDRHGYVVGPPSSCMSPKGYAKLPKGDYTFSVYAQGSRGHNSNVATSDFSIA